MHEVKRRFGSALRVLVPMACMSALACDGTMKDDDCGSQFGGAVMVASWWGKDTNSAEARALEGLRLALVRCNGGAPTATTETYDDKADLMQELDALLSEPSAATMEALPDVIQLNAGDTALKYTPLLYGVPLEAWERDRWRSPKVGTVRERTRHGNALSDGAVWYETMTPPAAEERAEKDKPWIYSDRSNWILPYISSGGDSIEVVPIAIHHVNRLYYNIEGVKALLNSQRATARPSPPPILPKKPELPRYRGIDSAGKRPPFNAQLLQYPEGIIEPPGLTASEVEAELKAFELHDWLALLASSQGIGVALPSDPGSGWALNLLAAENVKVALNVYEKRAPASVNETIAQRVMDAMEEIRNKSQLVSLGERWSVQEAMDAVKNGTALFTVMGDWSFPDAGDRVGMVPFPGTGNAFVYAIDGFVALDKRRPEDAQNEEKMAPAKAWLRVINDSDIAKEFAKTKGAKAIDEWLSEEVPNCAYDAFAKGGDCWVIPAMSMRGQECEASPDLLQWAIAENDEQRAQIRQRVESEFSRCAMGGTQQDGDR